VLRLYDAGTHEVETVRPGHRGELRVLAVTPTLADPGDPDLAELRGWLLPDQLRRTAERRSLVPTVCEVMAPGEAGAEPLAAEVRAALNFYPPARIAPAGEPVQQTVEFAGGQAPAFDVGTGDTGWLAGLDVIRYHAAPTGGLDTRPGDGPQQWSEVLAAGIDPLAVRLVFMVTGFQDPVDLSWDILSTWEQTLTGWRRSVAEWANFPSAAMPARYADAITAAFEANLMTPRALAELETLAADDEVVPGAKFEMFAAADRLLGLDLARDIGRY
jgi:hypothetical protein